MRLGGLLDLESPTCFNRISGERGYSFCAFDFDEPVNIRVKAKRAIKWLEILPSILKTEHRTIDDFTFEFKLEQPEDLTFFLNNDKKTYV